MKQISILASVVYPEFNETFSWPRFYAELRAITKSQAESIEWITYCNHWPANILQRLEGYEAKSSDIIR